MKKCCKVVVCLLLVIGALNWGLWGFFQFDFVAWLFQGNTTAISRVVYSIIGLAGVWALVCIGRCKTMCCHGCEKCGKGKSGCCK